jgi:hypothetical protein
MSLTLPPDWPPCGAPNGDHRRRGTACRARGDGWGQRCRHHGGLLIPDGPYAVVVAPAGIFVWRTWRGALHPGEGARQRVAWRVAALLLEAGTVDRAFFFGRKGQSLLRRLKTAGLAVRALGTPTRSALGLTQYAFRRKPAGGEAAA